jgi:hypothetical protein
MIPPFRSPSVPSPAEKEHILALVEEIRGLVLSIPNLKSREDKLRTAARMEEIKEEMKEFRRRYPYE